MVGLEALQLLEEPVVFGVGDLGGRLVVVQAVVALDLAPQPFGAGTRRHLR
jgi:hypothetical protein